MISTDAAPATAIYTERTTCRACSAAALETVLSLGTDVYLPRWVPEKDETLPKAPLELVRCASCGLMQLRHSVDPDLLYREFWYRTGMNQTMREAMRDLVRDGLHYHPKGAWLDIGANDGYLLSQVPPSFVRVAVEPAINFAEELESKCEIAVTDYFPSKDPAASGPFEIITSAAVFYDCSEPGMFVEAVKHALSPTGVWINQLNDAPGMMRQNAFDSICHEHAIYYDVPTLRALYEAHGLEITGISYNDVNGGSVRLTAMHKGVGRPADIAGSGRVSAEDCQKFARRTERWRSAMLKVLSALGSRGDVWGAGASTKGSVLLQYLQANGLIRAIGDRNPLKHGTIMAGTWTPVASEDDMRAAKPAAVVVLPWAFRTELIERETKLRESGSPMVFPLPTIEVVV